MKQGGSRRTLIWASALTTIVLYSSVIWLIYFFWVRESIQWQALAVAVSFAIVLTAGIVALLASILVIKLRKLALSRRIRRVRPLLDSAIGQFIAGQQRVEEVRTLAAKYPSEFETVLLGVLTSVRGGAYDRLSHLVISVGLADRWAKLYRSLSTHKRREAIERLGLLGSTRCAEVLTSALQDSDEQVREAAARALIRLGRTEDLENAFALALRENLFIRALLADELADHVAILAERAMPRVIESADSARIVAALEMIRAWGRFMTVPGFEAALHHPDGEVRAQALLILPYASGFADPDRNVLQAMADPDSRVRRAASIVAGELGLRDALPSLMQFLQEDAELSTVSANAIARLGDPGEAALERMITSPNRRAAGSAMEALEKSKLRQEW